MREGILFASSASLRETLAWTSLSFRLDPFWNLRAGCWSMVCLGDEAQFLADFGVEGEPLAREYRGFSLSAGDSDAAAWPGVLEDAFPALFAGDVYVADLASGDFGGNQKGAPGSEIGKAGVLLFLPDGKEAEHAAMTHAEHFVDGVGDDATIFDAVGVVLDEAIGPGLGGDHLAEFLEDDFGIIAYAHGRGVEAVHAIAVEPAIPHFEGIAGGFEFLG